MKEKRTAIQSLCNTCKTRAQPTMRQIEAAEDEEQMLYRIVGAASLFMMLPDPFNKVHLKEALVALHKEDVEMVRDLLNWYYNSEGAKELVQAFVKEQK